MKSFRPQQSGMVALMLVIWTSLALSGLLYTLVTSYGNFLTAFKIERERNLARSSALLCRDLLLIELSENARFIPATSGSSSELGYKDTLCHFVSFASDTTSSGENKTAVIEGRHTSSGAAFDIETKIVVTDAPGVIPAIIYTKEVSEKSPL